MVKATNHIGMLVLIVTTQSKVLSAELHVVHEGQFPLIINNVALLAGYGHVSFLASNQEESVIGDVQGLKVSRQVMLSQLVFIHEF